jgi:hypothetical protein
MNNNIAERSLIVTSTSRSTGTNPGPRAHALLNVSVLTPNHENIPGNRNRNLDVKCRLYHASASSLQIYDVYEVPRCDRVLPVVENQWLSCGSLIATRFFIVILIVLLSIAALSVRGSDLFRPRRFSARAPGPVSTPPARAKASPVSGWWFPPWALSVILELHFGFASEDIRLIGSSKWGARCFVSH